jgi:hypothetical protein
VRLTIDATDWDERADALIAGLGGEGAPIVRRVIERAMRKTATWLRNQIARTVAPGIKMPVKMFREMRVAVYINKEDHEAKVWIGANPIEARRFGPVQWSRGMHGARAGRRSFDGTFAANPPTQKHTSFIWRRSGEAPRIATKGRYAGRLREPLVEEVADIDAVVRENAARLEARALTHFRDTLAHELDFEISKVLAK